MNPNPIYSTMEHRTFLFGCLFKALVKWLDIKAFVEGDDNKFFKLFTDPMISGGIQRIIIIYSREKILISFLKNYHATI